MTKVPNTGSQRKNQWFRFYNEALDDPKVQRLPAHLFRTWINILCLASTTADGTLPSIDDMAFRLRMSSQDIEQHLSDLILAGLIDITPDGRVPHNWNRRQFVSDRSTERVRKHRKRKAETPCNVSGTADETPCNVSGTADETPCNVSGTADETPPEQSRAEAEQSRAEQTERADARDRPPDDQNFSDCKFAFNGSTEAMLSEVMAAMQPYGDRKGASQWLATTLRTNGAEPTAQAFQMLANARAEGQVIARILPWWSKTAASLKANPQPKPQAARDGPKHWREERAERAKIIYDLAMGVTNHA